MKPKVEIRKIESYQLDLIKSAVEAFLTSARSFRLDNAKTVLIKPNLLGGFPPEKAVTTHPVVLEAIIQYLLDQGKEVWLGDSPGGSGNVKQVWQITGMQELADKYPIKLVNLASYGVQESDIKGCKLQISKLVWQVDAIINVSKYKTHSLMAFTGAVKNLFGFVPGMVKTEYHKLYPDTDGFGHMIASLHKAVKHRITYNIMDGIVGMDGAGPSAGNPRKFGLLFGSASAPALDYIAATYMGFKLSQVGYLREVLHDEGIIPSQIIYPVSFNEFQLTDVDNQTAGIRSQIMRYVPGFMKYLLQKMFDFYPFITENCKACMICVKSCPVQTIKVGFEGIPAIMTDKCIRCLCCHEMCPHQAITIQKSPLARLILN
jgi:uncharacterized protein (DUF362 family)/NAD-dependent dihydropyrimidine dehydrogenase PreA subunit